MAQPKHFSSVGQALSHLGCYAALMKSPRARRATATATVELAWSHAGVAHRVTAWPEVRFQSWCGDGWCDAQPSEGAFAAAAADLQERAWRQYLDFVPARERRFIAFFRFSRLQVLQVIARCPELLDVLEITPALTVFVSAHVALRGTERPGWEEIRAVFERAGVFGLLEWLGLPATRSTLVALGNLADAEIPRRFLSPFRTVLWDQAALRVLERSAVVTDLDLARHCHRLAA